jgi:crotonobetainyl-CoA:carnitine CoA-transferase CaiB-like acyl-CoA transferase
MAGVGAQGPLKGLRVLELGHFVAAPFATRLLADLGADVIKVEPSTGDPVRGWGEQIDGHSLWWSMHGRGKRSIVLDLKTASGCETVLALAERSDVVVENFRPGHLDKLQLGDEVLRANNPDLIIAHISGYGQDGPYRERAAFGVIGEAIGGLRYLTNHAPGETDLPPVRVGVSIGDSIAGLYAAFGIVASLWRRERAGGERFGKTIDVALSEAVLSMMEGMLPEYGALGKIRQPAGAGIPTAAPSSAYPTSDGWILVAANSDPLFEKLATLIGRRDLVTDPRFIDNRSRCEHRGPLDEAIGAWTSTFTAVECEALLAAVDIPHSKVFTAKDCADDAQFRHRRMVREIDDPLLGTVLHAGIVPLVREEPGEVRWTGPAIGAHSAEILEELASICAAKSKGMVA